jgi:hypothetical protein
MPSTMIELQSLDLRATVSTVDVEKRTAELIFSTGAAVDRTEWMSGKRYREVLSLDPAHVRLDRLNNGAPLLDSHSAESVDDIIGTVIPGSARVANGSALARVRFSKRDKADKVFRDVADKIVQSVSVGYRVHKYVEDTPKDSSLPTRTAVDWEPYELSMVAMPADTGARVRAAATSELQQRGYPCVLERAEIVRGDDGSAAPATPDRRHTITLDGCVLHYNDQFDVLIDRGGSAMSWQEIVHGLVRTLHANILEARNYRALLNGVTYKALQRDERGQTTGVIERRF